MTSQSKKKSAPVKHHRQGTEVLRKKKTSVLAKQKGKTLVKRAPKVDVAFDLPIPMAPAPARALPPPEPKETVNPVIAAIAEVLGGPEASLKTAPGGRRKISRRKPGQKPTTNYFDATTQQAIVDYQKEPDVEKKKKIYVIGILPAFNALTENLINVYGYQVIHDSKQDLKNECLEFLYGAVNKFKPERGSKAFSYFNVVARNWLTIKSKQNTKKVQTYISIDNKEDISKEDLDLIESYQIMPSYDEVVTHAEVQAQLSRLIDTIEGMVKTENELSCISAIKTLISNLDDIDLLSKRAVLLYIREMTSLSPKQLSLVLSSLKKHYRELKKTEEFSY